MTSRATSEFPPLLGIILLASTLSISAAQNPSERLINFQQYRFGLAPAEFEYSATGPHGPVLAAGRPLWRIYVDLFAPSPKFVLIQASALPKTDHYPIALLRERSASNISLAVSFKLLSGNTARSAGVLWQAQDKDNYYAALVDDIAREVQLLRMRQGRRIEISRAAAAFVSSEWNSMKISVQADRIKIWLNDQLVLEARDMESITAGQLGLLTHADTVALFDDLHISDIPSRSDATMPTAAAQSGPAADKNIRTLGQRTLDFKP